MTQRVALALALVLAQGCSLLFAVNRPADPVANARGCVFAGVPQASDLGLGVFYGLLGSVVAFADDPENEGTPVAVGLGGAAVLHLSSLVYGMVEIPRRCPTRARSAPAPAAAMP